jgi:hypothetical protein
MEDENMTIEEVLAEIERAYPEDIFPETTTEERALVIAQFPGFVDRTSAMMGRHLARVIRRKIGAVEHVNAPDRLTGWASTVCDHGFQERCPEGCN